MLLLNKLYLLTKGKNHDNVLPTATDNRPYGDDFNKKRKEKQALILLLLL